MKQSTVALISQDKVAGHLDSKRINQLTKKHPIPE
jgi:hypothetical protein